MYYDLVSSSDDESSSNQTKKATSTFQSRCIVLLPWILTVIFASLTVFLGVLLDSSVCGETQSLGTFATGFKTDFVTAREYIRVQQHRFHGALSFDAQGNKFIPNPDTRRFVGDPRIWPEIDQNWDNVTWGRYVLITKEEAAASFGAEGLEQFWDHQRGGYVAGFDVLHTLHCLNNIRKSLNPDFYGGADGHTQGKTPDPVHQDHCIDQLRQYVMCAGDMTPVPTRYYETLGRNYVDSDVAHTCRNFDALQAWVVGRYEGPDAVEPRFNTM